MKRPNLLFDDPVGGAKDLLQHPLLVVQQCRRHHHPPSALPLEKIWMQTVQSTTLANIKYKFDMETLSSFHLELNLKCLSSGGSCEESHLKVWWKKKNCLFQKCEILRKDLQEWWRGSGKLVKNMRVPLRTWGLCCTFRYILPQWGLQLYFPEMWSLCFRTKIELNSAN